MSIVIWLKSVFSGRGKASSLYRRGLARARKHNHQGAIVDYTATIDMPCAPPDLKAMALYHRALVHVAAGNDQNAVEDLDAVVAMDEAPVNVRTMARVALARNASPPRKSNVKRRWEYP